VTKEKSFTTLTPGRGRVCGGDVDPGMLNDVILDVAEVEELLTAGAKHGAPVYNQDLISVGQKLLEQSHNV
jgi:hypothetical protein